ncbi:MAG: DEAD/DEAH box helicase family protein, partial [Akkermansia sp.]|nr:DEAD/DEAH box helicase family protein [Akkermansia sp.]
KVNTLVLVHNREIMKNWVEDFQKFLDIDAPLPTYKTRTGRTRSRKNHIGCLYSGHDSTTGFIDVAMVSSLGRGEEVSDIVKSYGMVIMDECHHAAAQTAEGVLRRITAKYVYGLTATPKRDDGMEPKMLMQLGPIRHRFSARE